MIYRGLIGFRVLGFRFLGFQGKKFHDEAAPVPGWLTSNEPLSKPTPKPLH